MRDFSTQFLRSTTTRWSSAVIAGLGVLLSFPLIPTALRWPARLLVFAAVIYVIAALVHWLGRVRWSVKGVAFSGVLILLMLAVVHVLCVAFMRVMSSRDDRLAMRGEVSLTPGYREGIAKLIAGGDAEGGYHSIVGWVPHAGLKMPGTTINQQGFRATHDYPATPLNRDKRVLCMGDSFTFGFGVSDDHTYPHHAEQLQPGTEWLNFGIAGGCLAQAYLHYLENARKFDGRYVIIGFMTNDGQRTVNCYRPFVNRTSGMAMTKPFAFIDNSGQFSIKPNPYPSLADYQRLLDNEGPELRKLLRQDYLTWGRTPTQAMLDSPILRTWLYACNELRIPAKLEALLDNKVSVRPFFKSLAAGDLYGDEFWAEDSKGFRALCGMFDLFHATVVKDERIPLIVIIPGPHDVADFQNGDPRQYESLNRFLRKRGYHVLDFLDTLIAKHRHDLSDEALFVQRHYQGPLNRELAAKIIENLPPNGDQ